MEPIFVPYAEWCKEAQQVAQEDLQLYGFSVSPESIMRRAHSHLMRVEEEAGCFKGVWVWDGWKEAMRKHREKLSENQEAIFYCPKCETLTLHNPLFTLGLGRRIGFMRYVCAICAAKREQALRELTQLSQKWGLYD